jgi:hypothetical protein
MDETHALATRTDKQLSVHEAICAARYDDILKRFETGSKRMQRIEYILYLIAAMSLFGPDHAASLIKKLIML